MATEYVLIEANIDLSKWDSAIQQMLADAASIQDSLTSFTLNVDVDSDFGTVEDAIATIEESDPEITVGADVSEMSGDVETEISTIEESDPEVTVGGDPEPMVSAVDEAVLGFDDVEAEVPVTGDTQDIGADITEIKNSLNTVKKLAIVDFIFNIPANFNAFVDTMTNLPGIGFLVEVDETLSHIAARTGELVPNLQDVVEALRIESGDTQAIEDALTFLIQNGETGAEALKSVSELGLDFVDVWGGDVVNTLATAQQLVKSGLVPSIEDAFNVMTLGMQSGANAQGDFLTFLEKGAANFVELGFTAQEAVALAAGAIDAGVPDLQRYGQVFMGLRKDIAAGGEETQAMLAELELDPDNIGFEGYLAIIDYLGQIEDQAVQTQAITDTFGSRAQGLTAPQLLAPPDMEALEQDTENLASSTGDAFERNISDSLNKAVDSFQVEMVSALDDALNISGFIDKITGAAVTFSSSIKEGMTIGQALELSLALPENSFASFESSVGNFAIGVLQLIAGVQDFVGADSSGTRAAIARQAETQLAFDLQVANPEDVANIIQTAIDRGVDDSRIQEAVGASVQELVDAGNLEEASTLISTIRNETEMLSEEAGNLIQKYGSAEAAVAAFATKSSESYDHDILPSFEAQQAAIKELEGSLGALAIDTAALQAPIDEQNQVIADQAEIVGEATSLFLDGVETNFDNAVGGIQTSEDALRATTDDWQKQVSETITASIADATTLATEGTPQLDIFTGGILAMSGALTDTINNLSEPLTNFAATLGSFVTTGNAALEIGGRIGAQGGVVATEGGGGKGFASGTGLGGTGAGMFTVGEDGEEIVSTDTSLSVLNNQTTEAIYSALRNLVGGGGNSSSSQTINLNINMNVQGQAAALGFSNDITNRLRGFGAK